MLACAGIADVDTREITRRLRDTGALNGIITTDMSAPVEELVEKTKSWSILGKVRLQTLPSKSCRCISSWAINPDCHCLCKMQWLTGFQSSPQTLTLPS